MKNKLKPKYKYLKIIIYKKWQKHIKLLKLKWKVKNKSIQNVNKYCNSI